MNNEELIVEEEKVNIATKITELKIAKYAFTALAGVATLVTTGIAIAAGLGALISEISLERELDDNKINATK